MAAPYQYNVDQPWVRQPFDGDLDWALFQDFLSLSGRPRNVRALVKLGAPLSVTQLENLAWEKGWVLRADLWDQHLDQVRRQAIETEIQEDAKAVAKRHQRGAKKLLALVERELDKYAKASEGGDMPGLLTPRDIIRGMVLGVRIERLVLGDSTERVEQAVDLSSLTLEELRALREIQEKAKAL